MKIFSVLLLVLVSGCSTVVPVTAKFPEPPGLLATQPCNDLKKLNNDAQLSDVSKTVAENYTSFHECSIKLNAWREWYEIQRRIFEGIK